jgi:malonyl-CoA O-methyltransferase
MSEFKAGVARQFDRGARTYDRYADVQNLMADRILHRLRNPARRVHRVLELGCGTGYLTAGLVAALPAAHITAIDLSPEMVKVAAGKVPSSRVELLVADAETHEWERERFDLIVSNATAQWFELSGATTVKLAGALRPGGLMLHSLFGPRTFAELHAVLDEIEGPHARRPALLAADGWERAVRSAGLSDVRCTRGLEVRHYPDLVSFFEVLKGTGVAFSPTVNGSPWHRYRTLRQSIGRYGQRFGSPEGVRVTYELIEISGIR